MHQFFFSQYPRREEEDIGKFEDFGRLDTGQSRNIQSSFCDGSITISEG